MLFKNFSNRQVARTSRCQGELRLRPSLLSAIKVAGKLQCEETQQQNQWSKVIYISKTQMEECGEKDGFFYFPTILYFTIKVCWW